MIDGQKFIDNFICPFCKSKPESFCKCSVSQKILAFNILYIIIDDIEIKIAPSEFVINRYHKDFPYSPKIKSEIVRLYYIPDIDFSNGDTLMFNIETIISTI